jgi:hypothetical protein
MFFSYLSTLLVGLLVGIVIGQSVVIKRRAK